jgi:glucose-1-phosphate cytidylyltransferase
MKVLILAGGLGSRLSEETNLKPKPMVEIGGKPILWHIMKIYSQYGFNEFIILCGYKGYLIKEYFANYFLHQSNVTIDLSKNNMEIHNNNAEPWKITLLDTGLNTMTGGRIKQAKKYIDGDTFMLTYGDGVSNINISSLFEFHKSHGKILTMTSVQPEGRFGAIVTNNNYKVTNFDEKPKGDGTWINGGFFVCDIKVLDYISDDSTIFEREPLENLAKNGELFSYRHSGFWKPMDILRDKNDLEQMLEKNVAPWKIW